MSSKIECSEGSGKQSTLGKRSALNQLPTEDDALDAKTPPRQTHPNAKRAAIGRGVNIQAT